MYGKQLDTREDVIVNMFQNEFDRIAGKKKTKNDHPLAHPRAEM